MPTEATIEISDPEKLPATPLVSVYMLAYKHERYIAEAIESVAAQRCDFPIELIIGEDCSPDRTDEIVRSYQKKYPHLVRVLTAETNVGAHANAARCRDACRGEYIAICEGDDYWQHPGKLQMQVDLMSANSNMTLCHTDYDRRIGFRTKRNQHHATPDRSVAAGEAYVDLLHEWTIMTATSLYRKWVVDEFRNSPFYDRRWPFGDYNLALYASTHGVIGYIPTSTATWRRVSGSASNLGPAKSLTMYEAVAACRHAYMAAFPVSETEALSIEKVTHREMLRRALWAEREDMYRSHLDWLVEHRLESYSVRRRLELFAIRMRLPIRAANFMRGVLRSLAELDPTATRH